MDVNWFHETSSIRNALVEEPRFSFCFAIKITNSVAFKEWRNIPEDAILHSHRRENLKSYIRSF
jgi:hypothetical protein